MQRSPWRERRRLRYDVLRYSVIAITHSTPNETTARRIQAQAGLPAPLSFPRRWVIANPVLRQARGFSYGDDSLPVGDAPALRARAPRPRRLPRQRPCARRVRRPPNANLGAAVPDRRANRNPCAYAHDGADADSNANRDGYPHACADRDGYPHAHGDRDARSDAYANHRSRPNPRAYAHAYPRANRDACPRFDVGACVCVRAATAVRRFRVVRSHAGAGRRLYAHAYARALPNAARRYTVGAVAPASLRPRLHADRLPYALADASSGDTVRSVAPASLRPRLHANQFRNPYARANAARGDTVQSVGPAALYANANACPDHHAYAYANALRDSARRPGRNPGVARYLLRAVDGEQRACPRPNAALRQDQQGWATRYSEDSTHPRGWQIRFPSGGTWVRRWNSGVFDGGSGSEDNPRLQRERRRPH